MIAGRAHTVAVPISSPAGACVPDDNYGDKLERLIIRLDESKRSRFTTCRNCTLFRPWIYEATEKKSILYPESAPEASRRLTAYYRAEPIYRAPVSDRDLFEGAIAVEEKPPSTQDPLQRATFRLILLVRLSQEKGQLIILLPVAPGIFSSTHTSHPPRTHSSMSLLESKPDRIRKVRSPIPPKTAAGAVAIPAGARTERNFPKVAERSQFNPGA
ncbi:hypothetical protein WN55_03107 [Dufourea novaeangliae]|uniref:Uncharacterized protein n=1 Tax=Dufourea novaeangliae TaxID=178035 RepID=A0A154PJR0_DUFNO|nr:hypothetical protein WN55_03107 [Dufourea novaeangliae]